VLIGGIHISARFEVPPPQTNAISEAGRGGLIHVIIGVVQRQIWDNPLRGDLMQRCVAVDIRFCEVGTSGEKPFANCGSEVAERAVQGSLAAMVFLADEAAVCFLAEQLQEEIDRHDPVAKTMMQHVSSIAIDGKGTDAACKQIFHYDRLFGRWRAVEVILKPISMGVTTCLENCTATLIASLEIRVSNGGQKSIDNLSFAVLADKMQERFLCRN
jgi:hypothetical protein